MRLYCESATLLTSQHLSSSFYFSPHFFPSTTIQLTPMFFFFKFNFYLFIFLFMAVLGLRFCARAFSSCGKWGPLFIAVRGPHYRGLSCCGAQAPDAQAQELWLTGLVAPRHVGSSQTRARTRVPCIGRQILNHCATREAPNSYVFRKLCCGIIIRRTQLSSS